MASKLSYGSGSGTEAPFARARSGDEPTTPATSTPSRRSASTWTTPMNPVPTTAARSSVSSGIARRSYEVAGSRSHVAGRDERRPDADGRGARPEERARVRGVDSSGDEKR